MQSSVQICVFFWSLSFTQREEEKESLVKKWEPILNARVKTLEMQQLKMRI